MQAIGLFELQGYVPASAAVDTMLKAADVKFLTWEKKLGGWLVTIIIQGEVSAVQAALDAGMALASASRLFICQPDFVSRIKRGGMSACRGCYGCFRCYQTTGKRCVLHR